MALGTNLPLSRGSNGKSHPKAGRTPKEQNCLRQTEAALL